MNSKDHNHNVIERILPFEMIRSMSVDEDMSIEDFRKQFSTEEVCAEALFKAKWPNGYQCPRCTCPYMTKITSRRLPLYECSSCYYQASLLTGTVMERSKTDLRKWFTALFLFSQKNGQINASQLKSEIEVTYKTAWLLLTKIRTAVSQADDQTKLSGHVRINPGIYRNKIHATATRHPQEQILLVGATIDPTGKPCRIKLKQMVDFFLSGRSITPLGMNYFVQKHVDARVDILRKFKVTDPVTKKKKILTKTQIVSPYRIECVSQFFSRKRCSALTQLSIRAGHWLNKVFCGVSRKHLQKYLDEFCFRWNLNEASSSIFDSLFHICTSTSALTYKEITNTVPGMNSEIQLEAAS